MRRPLVAGNEPGEGTVTETEFERLASGFVPKLLDDQPGDDRGGACRHRVDRQVYKGGATKGAAFGNVERLRLISLIALRT